MTSVVSIAGNRVCLWSIGYLIKQYEVPLSRICRLNKYNDNPPPIRLYTNPWPFSRTRPFTKIIYMRCFHRTFAMGVACRQGTLTPPDIWFRPIWDLHMFYLLRPFSPKLVVIFPDYPTGIRTSLGTFSILLKSKWEHQLFETAFSSSRVTM